MDHPLREDANRALRKRVIELFKIAYSVPRGGNIVFVCGGNEEHHMRPKFRDYCVNNLKEFEIFFPEFAMKDYFSSVIPEPFDISEFESMVGDLSHAIVIFPEAPGSFAETGYFSAISKLSEKTILALDAPRQEFDSFISMGPAKKISSSSIYQPNIQMDYDSPAFELVANRIKRIAIQKNRKFFRPENFSDISNYELFSLVQKIFSILTISTIEDLIFILRGLFSAQVSVPRIRHIASILVGVGYIKPIGNYGHYFASGGKAALLEAREGFVSQESGVRLQLAGLYEVGDPEFLSLVEAAADAD